MESGTGLKDPCEKESEDVAAHLNSQQKEDLTFCAQRYLRMMHFRQIHKVLGLEVDDVYVFPHYPGGRHHKNSGSNAPEEKNGSEAAPVEDDTTTASNGTAIAAQ